MIGRLERSFNEIRRFTADASHELRTPLTAIRTETEVALRKSLNPDECRQLLASILEECERLTRLTDQLLMLSREDTAASQAREPVDLFAVAQNVAETLRPLADTKSLQLSVNIPASLIIHGDEARLRQVLFNLLDNAVKYTPEGGRIEVLGSTQDHVAAITVQDSGAGIPPEHLPHVFERFYRVDKARTRVEGGTGLGLSIVESIVKAHGGEIELTSTPGKGTTCKVLLPEAPHA
jgi:signal transduction histidine kinase